MLLIRNKDNGIEKIRTSLVRSDEKKFISVKITHRCWFDQFNKKICVHKECHSNKELFSERNHKVYERDGNFRNLGFYMNTLNPYEDINNKYVQNVNLRIGRFLRSHIPVEMVHLIGISCILHVYDGYFRAPEINTLERLNKRLNQATAKKLHMSSTPRLSFLNMPKRFGGLKLGSIKIRTITRIMNQIENFIHAKDIETRLTFEINVFRTFTKINSNRVNKLSWKEINTHPWSIKRLMNNKVDRLGRRLHLMKQCYIGINQEHSAEDWNKNILSVIPYHLWSKIIAIKIFHSKKLKSFNQNVWRDEQNWCVTVASSMSMLKMEISIVKKKRFFNCDNNFWSLGGVPFCRKPKSKADGTEEIVDQQLFRINTVRNIEHFLAVLRTTDVALKTSSLYRAIIQETDSEITLLIFRHKIRLFIIKALTGKLSTPMLLRFNSWYPNLNTEIKRLDNELGKDRNKLRKCGITGCDDFFNNNHVLNASCQYYAEGDTERKIAIIKVFLKCKYANSNIDELKNWNIINMVNKKGIEIDRVKKCYKENNGIIVHPTVNTSKLFVLVESDKMKIVMKDELITDEIIKNIVIRVLPLDNKYLIWFRNQRLGEIITNLFPNEIQNSNILMPWVEIKSQQDVTNIFQINTGDLSLMYINPKLCSLGFVPAEYIKWLSASFNVPIKRVQTIMSQFAIEMAKITKKLYKYQLKAHQFIRQEMGIIKEDPNKTITGSKLRSCGMCSGAEGVLCSRHKQSRLKLLKQRIGQGFGECSHFSKLMVAILPGNWHKIQSSKKRSEVFKWGLQILRIESIKRGILLKEIQI